MPTKRLLPLPFLTGTLGLILLFTSASSAQPKPEADLLTVMRTRAEAFFRADTEKWQQLSVQDSLSSRTILSNFEYYSAIGWPVVLDGIKKDSEQIGRATVTVSYANVHSRIAENLAFVEATEHQKWDGVDLDPSAGIRTYTLLVRKKKAWKVANQVRVAVGTYAKTPTNREYELNVIGYDLLNEKRVSEAIEVLRVNVTLHPGSWNAYDSLGEAYALAGDKKLAILNYEKSLALNPKNENGKAALAKLKEQ
ncbi:tetratricopeptide repeat protein [Fibrella sp. WM1]|uniref:tetratricopeptide repeat protein n=1 Tax=Fibrella musci TaxID=3242485 RepID=UPI003521E603